MQSLNDRKFVFSPFMNAVSEGEKILFCFDIYVESNFMLINPNTNMIALHEFNYFGQGCVYLSFYSVCTFFDVATG